MKYHPERPVIAALIAGTAMALLVTGCSTGAAKSSAAASTTTGRGSAVFSVAAPTTFVSSRFAPDGRQQIILSDAHSGAVIKTLLAVPPSLDPEVSGTAIAPDGDVWVTLNKGPACTSNIDGCGPKPHSCSSQVIAINAATGAKRTVLTGGDNELITDAQPGPTGNRVAYLHSGCATSYLDNSLRIRDLSNGQIVSIGEALPRCHFLFQPRWTNDGKRLLVVYGQASTTSYHGAQGTCGLPHASTAVVVSAQASQPGVRGTSAPLDAGCQANAVAVTHGLDLV